MTDPSPMVVPQSDFTNVDGKVEVTAWTADTIASYISTKGDQSDMELLMLGLLIQGGAIVTLPANYLGVAYTP